MPKLLKVDLFVIAGLFAILFGCAVSKDRVASYSKRDTISEARGHKTSQKLARPGMTGIIKEPLVNIIDRKKAHTKSNDYILWVSPEIVTHLYLKDPAHPFSKRLFSKGEIKNRSSYPLTNVVIKSNFYLESHGEPKLLEGDFHSPPIFLLPGETKSFSIAGPWIEDPTIPIKGGDLIVEQFKVALARPDLKLSCRIEDSNGNGVLDAGESATMIVTIKNEGKGKAENVRIRLSGFEGKGVSIPKEQHVGNIPPTQSRLAYFPVKVASGVEDSTLSFVIQMIDGRGYCGEALIEEAQVKGKYQEDLLYAEARNGNSMEACLRYISEFPDGKYLREVEDILEQLRWKHTEKSYTITDYEDYLCLYPKGKYAKLVYERIKEVQAIAKTKKLDTYEAYKKFPEEYPNSRWAPVAKKRTTLKYWQPRLKRNPKSSHIMCQVAQALVEERGELGYRKAKEYYRQVIEIDRNNEQAYIGLGKILLDEEDHRAAKECLEQALSNGHNNYKIYYSLGRAYEGLGGLQNRRRAIDFYTEAIREKPNFIEYLYSRAVQYRMILQPERAKEDFKRIAEIAPNSSLARDARVYLEKMR